MGNRLRASPTGELQHGVQQSQYGGHYAYFNKESHDGVHSFSFPESYTFEMKPLRKYCEELFINAPFFSSPPSRRLMSNEVSIYRRLVKRGRIGR
jgi:hypothetical protein